MTSDTKKDEGNSLTYYSRQAYQHRILHVTQAREYELCKAILCLLGGGMRNSSSKKSLTVDYKHLTYLSLGDDTMLRHENVAGVLKVLKSR